MKRKTKQILKVVLILVGIFGTEGVVFGLINLPPQEYFSETDVEQFKNWFYIFTHLHRNPSTALYIEPTIEANYYGALSINKSDLQLASSEIIDPTEVPIQNGYHAAYYLLEKQNFDGGHGDFAGVSSLKSSFEVVNAIDFVDDAWLNQSGQSTRVWKIKQYLNNTFQEFGWGFKPNIASVDSDIQSTYHGVSLADRFNLTYIISNTNISNYLSLLLLGGYRENTTALSPDPESTYYGIQTHNKLGLTYSGLEITGFDVYFDTLYDSATGGYSSMVGLNPDIESTYFVLCSMYALGLTPHDVSNTFDFIKDCQDSSEYGGFQLHSVTLNPEEVSDFKAGWAGSNALRLLRDYEGLNCNTEMQMYYSWLSLHQALNGLFGFKTVESNYWGVYSTYLMRFSSLITENGGFNAIIGSYEGGGGHIRYYIQDYLDQCFDDVNGGFASIPDLNSSLYSTFAALETYSMLGVNLNDIPNRTKTISYIISRQNDDGGFQIGNDLYNLGMYFPTYADTIESLLIPTDSCMESTFWAISALQKLGALNSANLTSLRHWVNTAQNPDGGYALTVGSHSDLVSTYHAISITSRLRFLEPMSKMSAIEFLKSAQSPDGGYSLIPALSTYLEFSPSFLVTYMGARSLYDLQSQPDDVHALTMWYASCASGHTLGIGDSPGFGADLRNMPYALEIIDEIRIDQGFDPVPWNKMLTTLFIVESIALVLFIVLRIFAYIGISITKRMKDTLGIGKRFNVSYLQKFPAINCENLTIYAGNKVIINHLSLRLEHGHILGVLGESGAGKSTFVKALLGMRKFTGINEIYGMDVKKYATRIRPIYGYVPQDLSKIYHDFTVMENLLYFGMQYGLTEKEILRKGRRLLRSLEIEDKEKELIKNLSGGQKRRASIAIALIHSPIFCVLDEPTSGLDPVIRENLWLALTELNELFNTTFIVISHYPEESRFCHAVAIFGRGKGLIDYGHPRTLLDQMPGKGRAVSITFKDIQIDAINRLESIKEIEKSLEMKVGTDYTIYSDNNLKDLAHKITDVFGEGCIHSIKQSDAKMEEYFRYKSMEVPDID